MKTWKINSTCRLWLVFAGLLAGMAGCRDEEGMLEPSGPELKIEVWLTGGNPELDRRVREIYERTGIVVRYKYDENEPYIIHNKFNKAYIDTTVYIDAWYSVKSDNVRVEEKDSVVYINDVAYRIGVTRRSTGQVIGTSITHISMNENRDSVHQVVYLERRFNGIQIEQPDEEYVAYQLDLLEQIFLSSRSKDKMLKPNVVFLGKNLSHLTNSSLQNEDYQVQDQNLYLSYGDESITELDTEKKKDLFVQLNIDLYSNIPTPTFSDIISDEKNYPRFDFYIPMYEGQTDYYGYGWPSSRGCNVKEYMKMILQTPYVDLIAEPELGHWDPKNPYDYKGCLHPKRDRNMRIRAAYDAIIEDFNNYGIDIQALGNNVSSWRPDSRVKN